MSEAPLLKHLNVGRMMRIEATYTTGAVVKDKWEYEPDLRVEIKQRLADELAMKMRFNDLIDFVLRQPRTATYGNYRVNRGIINWR